MSETVIKSKNNYELYMLLSPSALETDISSVEETISKILQKHEAQIERSDRFVKKDLAFPINKFGYAYVANIYFFAPADSISEIKTELNLSDVPFLRLMVTRVEKPGRIMKAPRRRLKPKEDEVPATSARESKKEEKPKKAKDAELSDKDKVTLEEIDRRLDEIMGNL